MTTLHADAYLYSLVLDLQAGCDATLPPTTGQQTHALFLELVRGLDAELAARLHDEPQYRPFTVSPLLGAAQAVRGGGRYGLRLTLLDGGPLWQRLTTRFLTASDLPLRLGSIPFQLRAVRATPGASSGQISHTTWATLAATPAQHYVTLRFATPTAFNLGDKRFALFPEPRLVWDSLLRVWNNYAPPALREDKPILSAAIAAGVIITDYQLHTTTLHYPDHPQKGFIGTCTYRLDEPVAAAGARLARFAPYAGVGYKTTQGMGQVLFG